MFSDIALKIGNYLPPSVKNRVRPIYNIADSLEKYIMYNINRMRDDKIINTKYGFKMAIDTSDYVQRRYITKEDSGEEYLIKFFSDKLRSENITGSLLDIGANVGFYSLIFNQQTGNPVYAFEPLSFNCHSFRKNMELNNFDNYHLYDKGLSNSSGSSELYYYPYNKGAGGQVSSGKNYNFLLSSEEVEFDKLDSVDGIADNISIIKIDVEGHELDVLLGGEATIKNNLPYLMIEIHPAELDKKGQSVKELLSTIFDFGYEDVFLIQDGTKIDQKKAMDSVELVESNYGIWCS